jgi:8-oxo-dGTP pyrophosphatase MutT (NUDIX family)
MGRSRRSSAVERQHSAGGVVVRGEEVLLIATQGGRRWQLPKGHVEEGELPEQTALREVQEETGVRGRVLEALPGIDYTFLEPGMRRIQKHVDYFLVAYESGSEKDFDPKEVSGAAWFAWPEAIARLSFANDRRVAAVAWDRVRRAALTEAPR